MTTPFRRFLSVAALLITIMPAGFTPQSVRAQNAGIAHPDPALAKAAAIGPLESTARVDLALALPLRNQASLNAFLKRVYDPNDPLYGHYLTSDQFAATYGPTEEDYAALQAAARRMGFAISGTHRNRLLLDISAPAATVQSAFHVRLTRYQAANGRPFFAPDSQPVVPSELAGKIAGIAGLDSRPMQPMGQQAQTAYPAGLGKNEIGTGPLNGLTPSDIKNAYNLNGLTVNGAGQTLAVVEFDGYNPADVQSYETYFSLPSVPISNVYVDSYSGQAGSDADEVTLDIELQAALAPGASAILVYEAPNTSTSALDVLTKIAEDNKAKSISDSWGQWEQNVAPGLANSENQILQEMAAQGQSFYVASGDDGAIMSDPATQPYAVAVGGTTLETVGAGGPWQSESTWNSNGHASGGGISTLWSIPFWQVGVGSAAGQTSTTNRNVPDVALDSDPNTGYSIYYKSGWTIYGGTSCAAPLWAAFTALVNQQRAESKKQPLGFPCRALYNLAKGTSYRSDYHDIADDSNNDWYQAVKGYDNVTGWGTMNGGNLFNGLVGATAFSFPPTSYTQGDIADAHVRSGSYANSNFGSSTTIVVAQSANANNTRIAFLKFDISSLPNGITSAQLKLYGSNSAAGYSGTASVYAVSDNSWTETGLTYDNQPAIGTKLASATITHKAAYVAWDITSYLQAQKLAGNTQVSLAVTMDNTSTSLDTFNARENTADPPKLVTTGGTLPTAPFGLLAFPHSNRMTLYWVMPDNAATYSVYRAASASGPYTVLSSDASEPYTDYTAVNGTTYWYYVTAANPFGMSGPSATVFDTPSVDVAPEGSWLGNFIQNGSLLYAPVALGGADSNGGVVTFDLAGNEGIPSSWTYNDLFTYGANPIGPFALGSGGYMYGTEETGGQGGNGTVLEFDSSLNRTVLHAFEQFTSGTINTSGAYPDYPPLVAPDGTLIGTAALGGIYGDGVAYSIATDGTFTKLHDFSTSVDGDIPTTGLTLGPDGNYYGVARGGANNCGTLYSITPSGSFQLIHSFTSAEGVIPYSHLVLGPGGYLYGVCAQGGTNNSGTLYRTDTLGNITVLHNFGPSDLHFAGPDGVEPLGNIVVMADGTVFGSTFYGGANGTGVIYKIDPSGNETFLHVFGPAVQWGSAIPWANADGSNNPSGVVMASDGNLYGMMYSGGKYNEGVAFQCTPSGVYTNMHSFHGY